MSPGPEDHSWKAVPPEQEMPATQDDWVSQTGKPRCVLSGRLLDGDKCTVIVVRDRDGVTFYPHGGEKLAVKLDRHAVRDLLDFLGGQS